ncbi:MAG: class I SAM-dependent methyltransferase, partial [Gammaproteobacteria bacterium]
MSRMLRSRRAADVASPGNAKSETVTSRLLPLLLEQIEARERIHVLDLGSGSQSTLNFFAGRKAAIHFVDLFSCDLVVKATEEVNTAEACAQLEQYLRLPEDLVFDVCMFWDALHYLSLGALEGLSRALAPHIGPRTLGYGFGSLHSGARADEPGWLPENAGCRYGIEDGSHLNLTGVEREGRYRAHTQQQLDEFFPALTIQKATLLRV